VKFELTILGSSSALPTSKRNLTAHVLNVYERYFLIDCGEGTQSQLRKNRIPFGRINHIFISHIHGDHFYGLFGLLSSFNLLKREKDLHIYAHSSLKKGIKYIMKHYEGQFSYKIYFHDLKTDKVEKIYEDEYVEVMSLPLIHKIPVAGFLFREKPRLPNIKKSYVKHYQIPIKNIHQIKMGEDYQTEDGKIIPNSELTYMPYKQRSYAFCTDTAYNEFIIPWIENVDLLYHEATFKEEHRDQAENTYHSTAKQAASIARKANVKKLIIGHFSARYKSIEDLVTEATSIFPNTVAAEDGLVEDLSPYKSEK
jgi:ribonuclease Z